MGASSSSAVPTIVAAFFGISGVLSLCASLFTLYLVNYVTKKGQKQLKSNTFLTIVACIAVGQAVYDFSLLLYGIVITFGNNDSPLFILVMDFFEAFSFISTSLWTNVLNSILFYVVVTSRSIDVSKRFRAYCFIVYVPSFLVAVPYLLPSADASRLAAHVVDYSFRIFSIAVNILVYLFISFRVYSMKLHMSEHLAGKAIYVLVRKLKYYSVVLIVSRFFATWYEFEWDLTAAYNANRTLENPLRNFVFCMSALLTPTAGLGYLVVFLIFNETARSHSYKLVLTYCCCHSSSPLNDKLLDNNDNNNNTDQEGEAMDEASSYAYGYGVAQSASQIEAGGGNVEEEEEGYEGEEEQQSISARTSNSSRLSSSSSISLSSSALRTKSKTLSKSRSSDSSFKLLELLDEEQLFREIALPQVSLQSGK